MGPQMEDNQHEINNFEDFFTETFGNGKQLISYKTKNLTLPGENYGSLMLTVEIQFLDEDNSKKTVHAVAKMVPDAEFVRIYFRPEFTFKKEREIYNTAMPTIQQFIEEHAISGLQNVFPKLYGSRLSLSKESEEIDLDNAIILMENLKLSDYKTVDRLLGFDFIQTKFLLENLAEFHAVPLALKLLKSQVFHKKIMPYLESFPFVNAMDDETFLITIDNIIEDCESMAECRPYLARIRKSITEGRENVKTVEAQEPFGTWVHNDYWVNNTMIQFINKNTPIGNKIVDYQVIEYNSPAKDVIFFLFSSVQTEILRTNYDRFIQLYFDKFVSVLKQFGCDISKFTFEQFQSEIDLVARKTEFFHIMLMMSAILLPQHAVKSIDEFDIKNGVKNDFKPYKEKISFIVQEFVKRDWI